jgi:hypothetical protein
MTEPLAAPATITVSKVALNDKVKLQLVLIGSPAIENLLYGVWR